MNANPPAPNRRNRWVAWIVLGIMGAMAAATLTFILSTRDVRREHDQQRSERRDPETIPQELASVSRIVTGLLIGLTILWLVVRIRKNRQSPPPPIHPRE